nr:hypothetical protein [uncultured Allomuricauda sp.]
MHKYPIATIVFCLLLVSCSSGDGESTSPTPPIEQPEAATLIFPYENETCHEGHILSDLESEVTFEWDAAAHTDSYVLHIKNLNSGNTQSKSTTATSQTEKLQRNTPYAWHVESIADGADETALSPTWKFYNAGAGKESYAPFPAEVVNPKTGANLDSSSNILTLSWQGSDPDNDLMEYDVYFDTVNPPAHFEDTVTSNSLNVSISPGNGTIYFWRIVSRDTENNTSQSEVFQFRVN